MGTKYIVSFFFYKFPFLTHRREQVQGSVFKEKACFFPSAGEQPLIGLCQDRLLVLNTHMHTCMYTQEKAPPNQHSDPPPKKASRRATSSRDNDGLGEISICLVFGSPLIARLGLMSYSVVLFLLAMICKLPWRLHHGGL